MDYVIKDAAQAAFGRREITIAETEMPGLMALRSEFAQDKPLSGARIAGCLHMTVQTAVLMETLRLLGAELRWASCNIYSTQDHAAAAMAEAGIPVFAKKGETLEEYWDYVDKTLRWPDGQQANLLLDDGGDLGELIISAVEAAHDPARLDNPQGEEQEVMFAQIAKVLEEPGLAQARLAAVLGVSEETTTGVARLEKRAREGTLPFPAIDVNNAVTKSKFDNRYGCRESLVDGIRRATDVMMAGKLAVVCGYGDVGKGCAQSLSGAGARVAVTEIDPICALQAAMDGYAVVTLDEAAAQADIVITATGNRSVVTLEHMRRFKDMAILGNIGHFDNEIDVGALRNMSWTPIKDQVDMITFPDKKRLLLLSRGRLLNLGNATGHPSFVMSTSFSNQILAQLELWRNHAQYVPGVHRLPKLLDEKVARLHLDKIGVKLTRMRADQAAYLDISAEGPYKPEHYRY